MQKIEEETKTEVRISLQRPFQHPVGNSDGLKAVRRLR
jgi:hypothetical protein